MKKLKAPETGAFVFTIIPIPVVILSEAKDLLCQPNYDLNVFYF